MLLPIRSLLLFCLNNLADIQCFEFCLCKKNDQTNPVTEVMCQYY